MIYKVVGLTAVNALSTNFSIESWRKKEKCYHCIRFENGKKVFDEKVKTTKADKQHGCRITFTPAKRYLGADTQIPYEEVLAWVNLQSYLIPKENKINITFELWDGTKLKKTHHIVSRPFDEILLLLTDNEKYSPKLHLECKTSWTERARVLELDKNGNPKNTTRDVERSMNFEVVLRYIPDMLTKYDSFCNFTNTTQGGIHQTTFDEVFCRTVIAAVKESMSEAQWEKYKPTWDDVRSGLCCVMNLNTNAEVGFVGNVKEKIDNQKLVPILKACITDALRAYFDANKQVLDAYVKITKANAKARIDLQKVKEASKSERMNALSEHTLKKYVRCNNTGKDDFRELFIVEGSSASGSAGSACDHDSQAFLLLRGCTLNVFKKSFSEAMENEELKLLSNVLRAGIGKNFDVNKAWFNRVNLLTDSDIDGYNITLGVLGFIYRYMRPLIEAGMVYKVMAPLYRIDDKTHKEQQYVTRRSDITEIFFKNIIKVYKVFLLKNAGFDKTTSIPVQELKKDSLYDFLDDTKEYVKKIELLAEISGRINPIFLECVLSMLSIVGGITDQVDEERLNEVLNDQKFIKKFMSRLQRFYPELVIENHTIRGIVEGRYYVLDVNLRLIRGARNLLDIYNRYGFRIQVQEKEREPKTMTILEFLRMASKYNPEIKARFKGLGELNPDEMWDTVLDINKRISIQYTVDDVEKELETFQKLLSDKKKYVDLRKSMMQNYVIAREDLDN